MIQNSNCPFPVRSLSVPCPFPGFRGRHLVSSTFPVVAINKMRFAFLAAVAAKAEFARSLESFPKVIIGNLPLKSMMG